MNTQSNSPTVSVAVQLIESYGVPSDDCIPGLNVLFSTKVSGDSHQLERLLILAGELLCQAQILIDDLSRPRQELIYGATMLQGAICCGREIADALGVDHA